MIRPDIVARQIGSERQPIVIVDGFHPAPDTLRASAQSAAFEPARQLYPGIRAPLPSGYFARIRPALAPVLRDVFGHRNGSELTDASFSIVTVPPAALDLRQRMPHVDTVTPDRVALVHYLSLEDGDGTAFYRHRATGFETINEARSAPYRTALAADLRETGEPAGYINGDTELFERIAQVEARYNRAVIYRSASLHSGAIARDARLDPDPATGRLTVTAFLAAI